MNTFSMYAYFMLRVIWMKIKFGINDNLFTESGKVNFLWPKDKFDEWAKQIVIMWAKNRSS